MPQPKLVRLVIDVLEKEQIEYMVTGSIVSSLQGDPRLTHDVDIVVALPPEAVPVLLLHFKPPEYYLDEHAIRRAIETGQMFNLLDPADGAKVDFWMLTADPFDQSRFRRRILEEFEGIQLFVSRPEDTILKKLHWSGMCGGSEKQFLDALHVYEVQYAGLDLNYMESWASHLGVGELWERLKREAKPI